MPDSYTQLLGPAELFSRVGKVGWSRTPITYRRFDCLAEAVKFVVEDSGMDLRLAVIRVDDADFSGPQIQSLYDDAGFPLSRKPRVNA